MTPLASLTVVRPRGETWIALAGTGALLNLVALGVNLWAGESLPRGLEGSSPIFASLILVFLALTWWLVRKLRFRVTVERREDDLVLRVEDPNGPLELLNPQVRSGHVRLPNGSPIASLELRAGFFVGESCPLWLESGWGAANPLPSGWTEGLDVLPHQHRYRCLWGKSLPPLVDELRRGSQG